MNDREELLRYARAAETLGKRLTVELDGELYDGLYDVYRRSTGKNYRYRGIEVGSYIICFHGDEFVLALDRDSRWLPSILLSLVRKPDDPR